MTKIGIKFTVPNLDDPDWMSSELETFAETLTQIAWYCTVRAEAMRCRMGSYPSEALARDDECDKTYKALPTWAQW
jgi:hypothetical protein